MSALRCLRTAAGCILWLWAVAAFAEIRLPSAISDHAVLQRERPIHIWGWATPSAHLTARFHDQSAIAEADNLGKWSLYLKPEAAGGPYTLTISGDGTQKRVEDLLVGDVWLASGQSNMEMPLEGFPYGQGAHILNEKQEIANSANPRLRLLRIDQKPSDYPLNDIAAKWTQCTPDTAKGFSAVAYFFGREIAGKENVPIGLIDSTWGGTPADSWISMDTLGSDPALLPAFASRAKFADELLDLNETIGQEKREDEAAKAQGKAAPEHPWHPDEASWTPAKLYNGMIAPLTPLTLRGFLWYQGETNSAPDRAPHYAALMRGLIRDWRMHFEQGLLPFYYVQISSFYSPDENWGLVREEQRRALDTTNTAMAVTLDIGDAHNVHPSDKQTVGKRLAAAARALTYGEAIGFTGPAFRHAAPELQPDGTAAIRIWFDHARGLTLKGSQPDAFELAGADHKFSPADATIERDTVLVASKQVAHPVYVRYGYPGVISEYLYNADGFPASTFTSEENPVH